MTVCPSCRPITKTLSSCRIHTTRSRIGYRLVVRAYCRKRMSRWVGIKTCWTTTWSMVIMGSQSHDWLKRWGMRALCKKLWALQNHTKREQGSCRFWRIFKLPGRLSVKSSSIYEIPTVNNLQQSKLILQQRHMKLPILRRRYMNRTWKLSTSSLVRLQSF